MPTIYENMCNPETHKRKVDFDNHYTYLAYYLFKNTNGDLIKGEPHIILLEKEISDEYRSYIKCDIEDSYRWSEVKGEVVIEEISDDYFGAESFFRKVKYVSFNFLTIEDIGFCKILSYEPKKSFINNYFFIDSDCNKGLFVMKNFCNEKFFITISNDYIGIYQDTFFNCTPYLFKKKIEGDIEGDLRIFLDELQELLNIRIVCSFEKMIAYLKLRDKEYKAKLEEERKLKVAKEKGLKAIKIFFITLISLSFVVYPMHTLLFIGSIVYYVYMAAFAFWIFVVFSRGLQG